MSRVSFDYLADSVLLDPAAQKSHFSGLTDEELRAELIGYREHVLGRLEELDQEIRVGETRLGAYFGASMSNGPRIRQLVRAGLYFDLLVVDDPLLPHGREPVSGGKAYAEFLGYGSKPVNREAVAEAASLVTALQPLVGGDLLKLVPASLPHEPPQDLSVSYSPSLFSEAVPPELLPWFHDRAEIVCMRRNESGGWEPRPGGGLTPCRGIMLRLRGLDEPWVFHLAATKIGEPVPGGKNVRRMTQWFPDELPDAATFQNWITQSVNQVSGGIYRRVASDVRNAVNSGTMMFTDSELVSGLLSLQIQEKGGLREDLADLAMRFELPFLDGVTAEDLVAIRLSEGEAFENYRVELQRQLRDLRTIECEAELVRRLEEVQHEMAEVQVRKVQNEVRRLKQRVLRGAAIGAASLATVMPPQGLSLAGVILAGREFWKGTLEYVEVRREPAYFVWRLLERSK